MGSMGEHDSLAGFTRVKILGSRMELTWAKVLGSLLIRFQLGLQRGETNHVQAIS